MLYVIPNGVVCLVETWLCQGIVDSELYIPNYSVVRNRHGGGIAMYIPNSVKYSVGLFGLEFLLVTLHRCQLKISLGIFYRPPSSSNCIFDTLTDALLTTHQSCLSIIGDFNVNFKLITCIHIFYNF